MWQPHRMVERPNFYGDRIHDMSADLSRFAVTEIRRCDPSTRRQDHVEQSQSAIPIEEIIA